MFKCVFELMVRDDGEANESASAAYLERDGELPFRPRVGDELQFANEPVCEVHRIDGAFWHIEEGRFRVQLGTCVVGSGEMREYVEALVKAEGWRVVEVDADESALVESAMTR